ncbi:transmembrane protein 229A [Brachionichthys hirsutus]|uniref:transmembrane protein 229A n=1 Tax=Brachionichthys hirsutus TaxID=412623 RepID=UPI0036045DE1
MAGRWRDPVKTTQAPPQHRETPEETGDAAEPLRELPRWMRLYFYGMHGVTLDVLLSSLQRLAGHRDPKLVGFSSPFRCVAHSLSHFALEQVYARKRRFRALPAAFHLILYPSVYIGLQILIGSVDASARQVGAASGAHLAAHYVLALYFSQVFHRGLSGLRYRPSCPADPLREPVHDGSALRGLPGFAHFLFFGMHGFLDEVLFTSVFSLVETPDRSPGGYTSLWSFLMYGSCSFVVERLYYHLRFGRGWGARRRLPVYICFIYTWEFSWGLVLRQLGACSWDYSHYPHNFMGLVTLLYLPGWVCLSLYQDVLSDVLLRIKCAKGVNVSRDDEGQLETKDKRL